MPSNMKKSQRNKLNKQIVVTICFTAVVNRYVCVYTFALFFCIWTSLSSFACFTGMHIVFNVLHSYMRTTQSFTVFHATLFPFATTYF